MPSSRNSWMRPDTSPLPKKPKQGGVSQCASRTIGSSATIFSPPSDDIDPWASDDAWRWWSYTAGCWKSPEGKGSSIKHRMDHPVVCLNANDAQAYAKWAGNAFPPRRNGNWPLVGAQTQCSLGATIPNPMNNGWQIASRKIPRQ